MSHHLIFEGAELAGKSWLMSQVYDFLEPKYNTNKATLDGCHWFNCDVGVYGTDKGKPVINHYMRILQELNDKNLLLEKFHISDIVYNRIHQHKEVQYKTVEQTLKEWNFKIILITMPEDEAIIKKRIKDRLAIYPHYERILRDPLWYIKQQQEYIKEIEKSSLGHLVIRSLHLPDQKLVNQILQFIGE